LKELRSLYAAFKFHANPDFEAKKKNPPVSKSTLREIYLKV
jgi:hypothetical protein